MLLGLMSSAFHTAVPAGLTYGDYLVYVDESGDHSLHMVNPEYPMFVLAFCLFRKEEYVATVCPAVQRFKLAHFGHDLVVLHEKEIVRHTGPFVKLINAERRAAFFLDLNTLMTAVPVTLIVVAVDKRTIPVTSAHIYHLAMACGLERVGRFLEQQGQSERLTHVIFESRGRTEDLVLAQEFARLTEDRTSRCGLVPLDLVMCPKLAHATGLQVADLIARPIGRHLLNAAQPNRAYDILQAKFWRSSSGDFDNWGLTMLSAYHANTIKAEGPR